MSTFEQVAAALEARIVGELRRDRLTRTLYATDASIYQITPDGVLLPRAAADVVAAVEACRAAGVPVTARGAGTGLTGAAVNRGLQIDFSRHMNRIIEVDPRRRTATVEPGVVLDELNAVLLPHGLQFAPDVATSSRATIGGMIAVNSCGAHSVYYGRTCDHVRSLDVVLADGSRCTWGRDASLPYGELGRAAEQTLADLVMRHADEIAARYPKVLRSNGGYALDRVRLTNGRPNVETVICGSEGTLAMVVGATLDLTPVPACQGLLVVPFDELLDALRAVPVVLAHKPAAIELIDDLILSATAGNPAMARRRWFVGADTPAVLVCELFGSDVASLKCELDALAADLRGRGLGRAHHVTLDPQRQADVWAVRKAGLGLLMSRPGDRQPYAFIEDTAVAPERLPDFISELDALLAAEGVTQAGHYAHASVGCLHVRPVLSLKAPDDIARLRRIAERVAHLTVKFAGTMTGEHGDGIVRSAWHEIMYGPKLVAAFRALKHAFDPAGVLNPGKIVDPYPMTEHLRQGADYVTDDPATLLDFSSHRGMLGLAEKCTGVGQCRQRLVGTMCPSYMATGEEMHTTRARANALRSALSNRGLLEGLSDPALAEVMDLCISCKACQTECPTGTDMTRLKAEWLAHRNARLGVPRRSKLIASSIDMAAWGCHFAPLSNWLLQSKVTRIIMEHLFGLDRRVPPPRFARQTFRQWFRARGPAAAAASSPGSRPPVVFFVDTWTNFYQPRVGVAAVRVLEALGYEVRVPDTQCCGRPLLSKGLLKEARQLAAANITLLGTPAAEGIPIVGVEPSCISALLDEWPQLVRTDAARQIAARARTIESFVAEHLRREPAALRFVTNTPVLRYHGHCHQKALLGTGDAMFLLQACTQHQASEIDSGCCGMAGSFGHEVEHYDVARAIGEQRLFPAVRDRGDAEIAVSGFSCRHQIAHHTHAHPRHVIEYVAEALADPATE